jgi:thioredoxin
MSMTIKKVIMTNDEFHKRVYENSKPIIVDLWAPWCAPCRAMEPAFKQTSQKYGDSVDVLKINADESPEVLKALGVMGIPTVVGFASGKEILRRTGMQSVEALDILFDSTLHQRKPAIIPPAPIDRLIRSGAGLAFIMLGWFIGQSILLMGIGGVLLFSAFYDRCPIYRAIVPRLVSWRSKSGIQKQ